MWPLPLSWWRSSAGRVPRGSESPKRLGVPLCCLALPCPFPPCLAWSSLLISSWIVCVQGGELVRRVSMDRDHAASHCPADHRGVPGGDLCFHGIPRECVPLPALQDQSKGAIHVGRLRLAASGRSCRPDRPDYTSTNPCPADAQDLVVDPKLSWRDFEGVVIGTYHHQRVRLLLVRPHKTANRRSSVMPGRSSVGPRGFLASVFMTGA